MLPASFSNQEVSFYGNSSLQTDFDFNGDSVRDFYVYGNSGYGVRFGSDLGAEYYATGLTFGQEFGHADIDGSGTYTLIDAGDSGYYGFAFDIGGDTHYGWALFVVDTDNELVTVQSGGWQSAPFATATVGAGAIPEPSAAGALVGAGALMSAVALRRRRRSS